VFFQRSTLGNGVTVEERWFAALTNPSVLVHEMAFTGTGSLSLTSTTPKSSVGDLNLTLLSPQSSTGGGTVSAAAVVRWSGSNIHGELGNQTTLAMVCTASPTSPVTVRADAGNPQTLRFFTAIVTSLNSTNPLADANAAFATASADGAGVRAHPLPCPTPFCVSSTFLCFQHLFVYSTINVARH
jgi:hypothetical protein